MNPPPPNPEHETISQVVEAFGRVDVPPMPEVDQTVARLEAAQREEETPDDINPQHSFSWRLTMKRFSPLAAAAILILAIGGYFLFLPGFDSNAAFAQAVHQFRTAQTLAFTMTTAAPGQDQLMEMQATVKNPGWMHIEAEVGGQAFSQVFDFESQQMLMLLPGQKMAQRINMEGMPRGENPNDIVAEFGRLDPEQATYLHDEVKDGVKTHVYEIHAGPITGKTWIDAKKKRPVRMEFNVPNIPQKDGAGIVMRDFAWDEAVDDTKFSLTVPEGYEVREMDMSNAQPEDLATLLRVYAALSQEPYPADFGIETITGINTLMMDPALTPEQNQARLIERLTPMYGAEALADGQLQDTMMQMSATMGRGAIFMATLAEEAEDWRWVGGGATPGSGDVPLCWWKPSDSENYRVIFNDFTIHEVAPEDLPEVPEL